MRRFLLTLIVALRFTSAHAECPWYSKIIGGCDIGEAGKEVAENLPAAGMKTVNYWGYLLEKYHAGTPDEKEWARKIIQGELGIDPANATAQKQFEIALTFTGIDTTSKHLHVTMLEDSADDAVVAKSIQDGSRDAMSDFRAVNWPVSIKALEEAVNVQQLKADLKEFAKAGPKQSKIICFGGYPGDPAAKKQCDNCAAEQKEFDADFASEMVIRGVNPVSPRRTGAEVTFVWMLNPKIMILIPKHELDAQPNLELAVSVYRVLPNGTKEATKRFQKPHLLYLTTFASNFTANKSVDSHNVYYGRRMEIYSP